MIRASAYLKDVAHVTFDVEPWLRWQGDEMIDRWANFRRYGWSELKYLGYDCLWWTAVNHPTPLLTDFLKKCPRGAVVWVDTDQADVLINRWTQQRRIKRLATSAVWNLLGENEDDDMLRRMSDIARIGSYWIAYSPDQKGGVSRYYTKDGFGALEPHLITNEEKEEMSRFPIFRRATMADLQTYKDSRKANAKHKFSRRERRFGVKESDDDVMSDVVGASMRPKFYYAYIINNKGVPVFLDHYGNLDDGSFNYRGTFTRGERIGRINNPNWSAVQWVNVHDSGDIQIRAKGIPRHRPKQESEDDSMEAELVDVALDGNKWMKALRVFYEKKDSYPVERWYDLFKSLGFADMFSDKIARKIVDFCYSMKRLNPNPSFLADIWPMLGGNLVEKEGLPHDVATIVERICTRMLSNYNDPGWRQYGGGG